MSRALQWSNATDTAAGNALLARRVCQACLAFLLAAPLLADHAGAHEPAPAPVNSFVLPQPKALRHFNLSDHRGSRFDNRSLEGCWSFVLFGYTHCPDVCPTTLHELREVRRILASERADIDTATVFVTVDPQRDTRERLSGYVANFGEGVRGVHGAPASVTSFAEQFQVQFQAQPQARGAAASKGSRPVQYLVDHTASVALIGPDGHLHAVFMLPLRPERVATEVARLDARMQAAQPDINHPEDAK